jgi:hypothetical protein
MKVIPSGSACTDVVRWMTIVLALASGLFTVAQPINESLAAGPLRRTFSLLQNATPLHRTSMRVMFYGQSITVEPWHFQVISYLTNTYPNVDFTFDDRAVDGFSSEYLHQCAWADIYSWRPDLIIFYDFGSESDYEDMLRQMRRHTTADVLLQNNHIAYWDGEPTQTPDKPVDQLVYNDPDWHSYVYLPKAAARFDMGLLDMRTPWKAYLRTNNLSLHALAPDGIHLNTNGYNLITGLVNGCFRPVTNMAAMDPYHYLGISTHTVGPADFRTNHTLSLTAVGARFDAVLGPGTAGLMRVLIDGHPPSHYDACYAFSRASLYGNILQPMIRRVDSAAHRTNEYWYVYVTNFDAAQVWFRIEGSVTGPDGGGVSSQRFVSNSGRVVIEPDVWSRQFIGSAVTIAWECALQGADFFAANPPADSAADTTVLLADGLADGPHLIQLISDNANPPITAIRAYSPAGRAAGENWVPTLNLSRGQSGAGYATWPGWMAGWSLQSSDISGANWTDAGVATFPLGTTFTLPASLTNTNGLFRLVEWAP